MMTSLQCLVKTQRNTLEKEILLKSLVTWFSFQREMCLALHAWVSSLCMLERPIHIGRSTMKLISTELLLLLCCMSYITFLNWPIDQRQQRINSKSTWNLIYYLIHPSYVFLFFCFLPLNRVLSNPKQNNSISYIMHTNGVTISFIWLYSLLDLNKKRTHGASNREGDLLGAQSYFQFPGSSEF